MWVIIANPIFVLFFKRKIGAFWTFHPLKTQNPCATYVSHFLSEKMEMANGWSRCHFLNIMRQDRKACIFGGGGVKCFSPYISFPLLVLMRVKVKRDGTTSFLV